MKAPGDRRWTILDILKWTTTYFKDRRIEPARTTAEVLLAHVLGLERIALYLNYDQPLTSEERSRFRELIKRRAAGEPSQYLTGYQEFWSLSFKVNPSVLIPRPETEILVEEALNCFVAAPPTHTLEIGTGCGAVIVALAREIPSGFFTATDSSPAVLITARGNALRLGAGDRIRFFASDLFAAFRPGPHFDLIVSNPPYVSSADFRRLPRHIRDFEPRHALVAEKEGLAILERFLREAPAYLKPKGWLLLEIGSTQKERMVRLAEQAEAFEFFDVREDYSGLPRVFRAKKR